MHHVETVALDITKQNRHYVADSVYLWRNKGTLMPLIQIYGI